MLTKQGAEPTFHVSAAGTHDEKHHRSAQGLRASSRTPAKPVGRTKAGTTLLLLHPWETSTLIIRRKICHLPDRIPSRLRESPRFQALVNLVPCFVTGSFPLGSPPSDSTTRWPNDRSRDQTECACGRSQQRPNARDLPPPCA